MTYSWKTADSIQPWPWLLANPKDDQPLYQHQDDYPRSQTLTSEAGYWTEDQFIPSQSSSSWHYHTALAIGATVVCASGALAQYVKTNHLGHPDTATPTPANITKKQVKSDISPQVVTPSIIASQSKSNVLFSAADHNHTCQESTCKDLAVTGQQLPETQAQIRQLITDMQLFQKKHTVQNLQAYRNVLAYRSSDLSNKQVELVAKSQQLEQKFANVISTLALQPNEVSYIINLLKTDANYQGYLQQLQRLENAIADEFSNPEINITQLGERYAIYYQLESQLRQIAQNALANYIYVASQKSPAPVWQEASYQAHLQELIDLFHQHQMVVMEQHTLNQTEAKLIERQTELASLLREYATMQRQLDDHKQSLNVAKYQASQNKLT
ncbi:MAG: hypothetical protein F6K11_11885 [Leptolyngbya sp. SIO3F4]|nr:hypothetical protein [Leptolyngbya sp. SIO3F4]